MKVKLYWVLALVVLAFVVGVQFSPVIEQRASAQQGASVSSIPKSAGRVIGFDWSFILVEGSDGTLRVYNVNPGLAQAGRAPLIVQVTRN